LHGTKIIPEAGRDEKATLNLLPSASNIRTNLIQGARVLTDESYQIDTAPIREGEELNFDALENYLRRELKAILPDADLDSFQMEFRQFPGGHSNLTYLVHIGPKEFVLRRPPFGPVAPTAHDMPREYKLLAAINPVFHLAPRPYVLCEDTSIIGVPFYLMERRRGFVIRREMPAEIEDTLDLRRSISESLVDTLAALHRVDIHSTGLASIGKPVGFVTRQVRGWADRWQRSKTSEVAEIDEIIRWLGERIPPEPDDSNPATLVHNDFKLDNVMLDYLDPKRVVAVLDWEMCTVGDPLVDLGILLCYWPEKTDVEARRDSISSVTTEPGWMTRAEIIHRYGEQTGRDVSGIKFYEVFAIFKIAVVIQQIYFRYVRGQTHDERFREFGARVEGLAQAAMEMTEQ